MQVIGLDREMISSRGWVELNCSSLLFFEIFAYFTRVGHECANVVFYSWVNKRTMYCNIKQTRAHTRVCIIHDLYRFDALLVVILCGCYRKELVTV